VGLHLNLLIKLIKSFAPLKRYFKIYISGFEGASELREKLMLTQNLDETKNFLKAFRVEH
jgi:tRNA-dihydrouridine synthase